MKKLALAAVLVLAACGTKDNANNAVDTTMTSTTPTMTVDTSAMTHDTTMKADSAKVDSTMARDTAKTK